MIKYLVIALFLLVGMSVNAQNQGTNLYLIFNANEPHITKDVYKYVGNDITNPRIQECGVSKINDNFFYFRFPWYCGLSLELTPKQGAIVQTINISQVASLYPTARTAAQLDQDMQPAIDYDYLNPPPGRYKHEGAKTVQYLDSFDKIFVIEYLPNGTAKVVECVITTMF